MLMLFFCYYPSYLQAILPNVVKTVPIEILIINVANPGIQIEIKSSFTITK